MCFFSSCLVVYESRENSSRGAEPNWINPTRTCKKRGYTPAVTDQRETGGMEARGKEDQPCLVRCRALGRVWGRSVWTLEAALPHAVGPIQQEEDVHRSWALHHFPWKHTHSQINPQDVKIRKKKLMHSWQRAPMFYRVWDIMGLSWLVINGLLQMK